MKPVSVKGIFDHSKEIRVEKMRNGEITSRSETGIGEDAGNTRLTFWYQGRRVRLTCDSAGNVLKTSRASPHNRFSQRR